MLECAGDRALLFEDPTGVRLLYDPGNTVAGATDARLGEVHAVLVTHAHGDHLGGGSLNQDPNAPTASCGGAATTTSLNTIAAEIAAAKNSAVIIGVNLAGIIGAKIAGIRQTATTGCPAAGLTNEFTIPRTAPCSGLMGIGSKRTVRHVNATRGVQIATVPAEHPHELAAGLLTEPERTNLSSNSLGAYAGLANGFVLTFTNGLKVYLSGDTGLMADMRLVINAFYGPNLAVMNISDTFVTGPEEAAFAVTDLLGVSTVIPSHANEAATQGGSVVANTRTARFIELVSQGPRPDEIQNLYLRPADLQAMVLNRRRVSVYLPLSGLTMEFDGNARCQAGCQGR
ncbi:MAG: MBL fold metallo-hydrolase [Acidobacteria bacterium]|nr:MBL fold metallo-hydrolase [Acidobacteriota bacterium]